ncbi:MAG: DUF6449 domain-containing protein [Lachnospiraceae bacterium]|nr:DUF6449 domain-containing protein [Lachnospiraceae bacterium]
MTSAISFTKLIRTERKQLIWLTALQAVAFTLVVPLFVLMNMAATLEDQKTAWVDADAKVMLDVLSTSIGLDRYPDVMLALIFGAVAALGAFSYVHSREKLDFYHSLPLRRERFFLVRSVAVVETYAWTYALALAFGLLIGVLYHAFSGKVLLEVAVTFGRNLLFFCCSYAATLVAVMLTGKLLTTICALAVFFGYLPMLLIVVIGYFVDSFLTTCMNTEWLWMSNSSQTLKFTSPWAFCMLWGNGREVGAVGVTGQWPSITGICQLVAITVLLFCLALVLYRYRKSEAAGNALAFHRLEGVIKILIAVPVALICAILIHSVIPSALWELAAILISGTLFCLLMEFIYRWDIRQILMHKWHIAVSVGLALVIFFGFRYDVLGYNTYLPAQEEVASMAVRNLYTSWSYPVKKKANRNDEQLVLDYLETDHVELLYPLAENGVENQWIKQKNSEDYLDDTMWVDVKYTLKNGKEIYRSYEVAYDRYSKCMEQLLADMEYRRRMYPILTWDADQVVGISGNFYQGDIPELYSYADIQVVPGETTEMAQRISEPETETEWIPDQLAAADLEEAQTVIQGDASSEEGTASRTMGSDLSLYIEVPAKDLEAVLEAYQKDLSMLSFSEIDEAHCVLRFQQRSQAGSSWEMEQYPISGNFKNTIRLLAKLVEEQNQK